ncbi:ABC transporter permease [candidate division NPL-UPA2 bacterium]|nr:ABC transporter permease [candidate division NPL-UPA2 bacterium]
MARIKKLSFGRPGRVKLIVSLIFILAIFLMGIVGPRLHPVEPLDVVGQADRSPSREHPLGTDTRGRDVLAQTIHGTRSSLFIGLVAGITALVIGVIIGAVSGFNGGAMDEVLMFFTNIMLGIPSILLLLLVAVFVEVRGATIVAFLIGFTSWPWVARAVRSQIMSLRAREFVFMSRMNGLGNIRIALLELLPNMGAYIFMAFVFLMSSAMLAEAGLSMIGVGVTEGISLGTMLFWAQIFEAVRRGMFWWFLPPGAVLVAIATSLLVLSTALDEFFSPRLKER